MFNFIREFFRGLFSQSSKHQIPGYFEYPTIPSQNNRKKGRKCRDIMSNKTKPKYARRQLSGRH